MTKLQVRAGAAIAVVLAIALLLWQRDKNRRFEVENAALRQEMAQLRQANQSLSDSAKSSASLSEADLRDLMRLRAQANTLSQLQQENAQLRAERESLVKERPNNASSPERTALPEPTNEQAQRMARINFAKQLALACFMYADSHDDQFPADFAAIDPSLPLKMDDRSPTYARSALASAAEILYGIRGDQFELVYRGALHQVKNPGEVILMKEKQPTERSDGKFEKVYVFCDGHVEIKPTTDGDFSIWEKEHTFSEVSP